MKKVVTVSLGSSQQDFTFQTDFLGERFEISRLGADDDTTKAWELMRRHQASADVSKMANVLFVLHRVIEGTSPAFH